MPVVTAAVTTTTIGQQSQGRIRKTEGHEMRTTTVQTTEQNTPAARPTTMASHVRNRIPLSTAIVGQETAYVKGPPGRGREVLWRGGT